MRYSSQGRQASQLNPATGHRHHRDLLVAIWDIFFILMRAQSAEHRYEQLNRQCDAALAQQGLRRADLPRAIYNELTKGG